MSNEINEGHKPVYTFRTFFFCKHIILTANDFCICRSFVFYRASKLCKDFLTERPQFIIFSINCPLSFLERGNTSVLCSQKKGTTLKKNHDFIILQKKIIIDTNFISYDGNAYIVTSRLLCSSQQSLFIIPFGYSPKFVSNIQLLVCLYGRCWQRNWFTLYS
jgi:hypothetical protein